MFDWAPWFRLLLAVLATWRLAHLIAHEDGPFDLVVKLRLRAGNGFTGQLMDCPYCLSLWLAAPFAFLLVQAPDDVAAWIVAWLAISGGACFLEAFHSRRQTAAPPTPSTGEQTCHVADKNAPRPLP